MTDWEAKHYEDRTDEWGTPPSLWRPIAEALGGFDLDPCSGAEESQIADRALSKEDDGLRADWEGAVWMNPPYSEMYPWLEKAWSETAYGGAEVAVCLIPVRSATQWFQKFIPLSQALCLLEGRLQFVGNNSSSAPFPSALVVYGDGTPELYSLLDDKGTLFHGGNLEQTLVQARLQ